MAESTGPEDFYRQVHERWNARDAAGFAALFAAEGHVIGFDGSEMHGPDEIAAELGRIFAVVGMVPPGESDLNPNLNAVQTLVPTRANGSWRIALLQNTSARYHGRPETAEALTAELRELL